jgi:hypothetical protein
VPDRFPEKLTVVTEHDVVQGTQLQPLPFPVSSKVVDGRASAQLRE